MNLETKEINENVSQGGLTVKLRLQYPYAADKMKRAKRINAFVEKTVGALKEKALQSARFTYHSCVYSAYEAENGSLCIFFELTSKGKDKAYAYVPFAFTFDRDGRAVPLCRPFSKEAYAKAKTAFEKRGIKLSKREFAYSYRLTPGGAAVFASRRRGPGRGGYVKCEYLTETRNNRTVP